MDLRSTYNRIAKDWMEDHYRNIWWVDGADTFASFLKPGAAILDVGCGAGQKAKYFIEKGFRVIGIDFSEEMIALAKEQVPTGTFSVRDITRPLARENTFDGIFAHAVLLHVPKKDIANVVRNITAPLKAGGYLYIAVKELGSDHQEEKIIREHDYGYAYERFFSFFTLDELKERMADMGMRIVYEKRTLSGKTHWIQVIALK